MYQNIFSPLFDLFFPNYFLSFIFVCLTYPSFNKRWWVSIFLFSHIRRRGNRLYFEINNILFTIFFCWCKDMAIKFNINSINLYDTHKLSSFYTETLFVVKIVSVLTTHILYQILEIQKKKWILSWLIYMDYCRC